MFASPAATFFMSSVSSGKSGSTLKTFVPMFATSLSSMMNFETDQSVSVFTTAYLSLPPI